MLIGHWLGLHWPISSVSPETVEPNSLGFNIDSCNNSVIIRSFYIVIIPRSYQLELSINDNHTDWSVRPTIHPSIHPSNHPSIHQSINQSIRQPASALAIVL